MSGKILRTRDFHTKGSSDTMPKTAQENHNHMTEQFKLDKTTTLCWSRYWDISNERSVGFDAHFCLKYM